MENILEVIVAICAMTAALVPLYIILLRVGRDAKSSNEAVNCVDEHKPRLADNVLELLDRTESIQAELSKIRELVDQQNVK